MRYHIDEVFINVKKEAFPDGYFDEDQEERFPHASAALSYINENGLEDEDCKIEVYFKENGSVNSASLEDLDYGEQEVDISQLKDLADLESYPVSKWVPKEKEVEVKQKETKPKKRSSQRPR